ncbi:hypothetical protein GEMRC1_010754 [Eukaryota sp. GEM-RC1]
MISTPPLQLSRQPVHIRRKWPKSFLVLPFLLFLVTITVFWPTLSSTLPDVLSYPSYLPPSSFHQNRTIAPPIFSLLNHQHPQNQFVSQHQIISPSWYIFGDVPTDNFVSFKRFGINPHVLDPTFGSISPVSGSFLVVASSRTVLIRPDYHVWFQKTLDELESSSSAVFKIGSVDWVIISTRTLTLSDFDNLTSHRKFAKCYWNSCEVDLQFSGLPFSTLKAGKYLHSVLHQARIDASFDPLFVLDESHLRGTPSLYEAKRTAYVYSFMGLDGKSCSLQGLKVADLATMISSVKQLRRHTDRRIILLVQKECQSDFVTYFDSLSLDIEIVSFSIDLKLAPFEHFQSKTFRASFYLKSYFLMKINDLLHENPLDRIISIDWDFFVLESFDHLFDAPVPKGSLLGTSAHWSSYTVLNGGLLVFSPGNSKFVQFWQYILKNWNNWSYFHDTTVIKESEQETFLYFFRKHNLFYMLPSRYNVSNKYIAATKQCGGDIGNEDYASIHFAGMKPDRCLVKGGTYKKVVEQYVPSYISTLAGLK